MLSRTMTNEDFFSSALASDNGKMLDIPCNSDTGGIRSPGTVHLAPKGYNFTNSCSTLEKKFNI